MALSFLPAVLPSVGLLLHPCYEIDYSLSRSKSRATLGCSIATLLHTVRLMKKFASRSGISIADQKTLLLRGLHTTTPKANQTPGSGGSGGSSGGPSSSGGDNKNDDDEKKGMLAKAALWMLTAYMFIAIISLLFPSSNQPEVRSSEIYSRVLWSL